MRPKYVGPIGADDTVIQIHWRRETQSKGLNYAEIKQKFKSCSVPTVHVKITQSC